MEVTPKPLYNSLKRYWRRGSYSYQRLDHSKANTGRKIKTVKFTRSRSTTSSRRFWRIKAVPKLRFKNIIGSSAVHKLWNKFRNVYMQMMVTFSGKMWYSDSGKVFEDHQQGPKPIKGSTVYSADEFESRIVYEIYKSILESRPLSSVRV